MFPLPPSAPVGAPGGAMPSGMPSPGLEGVGLNQIGKTAVDMAMEIDQACKMLAKMIPPMAPLLGQFVSDLRIQLGSALNAGATAPLGAPDADFPDGSSRLSSY